MDERELSYAIRRGAPQFQLRLPDGLRDAIKLEAVKNRRSMNSEIVMQLERIYVSEMKTVDEAR